MNDWRKAWLVLCAVIGLCFAAPALAHDDHDAGDDDASYDDASLDAGSQPDVKTDSGSGHSSGVAGSGCAVTTAASSAMGMELAIAGMGLVWLMTRRRSRQAL